MTDAIAKTCGNCSHWGGPKDTDGVFKSCQAVVHDDYWRAGAVNGNGLPRDLDTYRDYLDEELEPDVKADIIAIRKHLAVVQDGSGFYAALKTREDFGCVMWKPSRT